MHKIYANIDKRMIDQMPLELFEGRIFTITTEKDTDKAVKYLSDFRLLGIDTETRPNFNKSDGHKVGLLQISTHDTCFLFRLNHMGLPDSLVSLLSNKTNIKVGLSVSDDIRALHKRRHFRFGRYVELQRKVRNVGILDQSLQKIYANMFGKKISKSKRLTNWDAPTLTEGQKKYAATDAWACLRIYDLLEEFRTGLDYEYVSPMNNERMLDIWINMLVDKVKEATQDTETKRPATASKPNVHM